MVLRGFCEQHLPKVFGPDSVFGAHFGVQNSLFRAINAPGRRGLHRRFYNRAVGPHRRRSFEIGIWCSRPPLAYLRRRPTASGLRALRARMFETAYQPSGCDFARTPTSLGSQNVAVGARTTNGLYGRFRGSLHTSLILIDVADCGC